MFRPHWLLFYLAIVIQSSAEDICECPSGFELNTSTLECDDIDECTGSVFPCSSCVNIAGSFLCPNGLFQNIYEYCTDKINPCGPTEAVSQCSTENDFFFTADPKDTRLICDCNPGFVNFNQNKKNKCIPNEICDENVCGRGDCSLSLTLDQGYTCSCWPGYQLIGGTCKDENECELTTTCNEDKEICRNVDGSYYCECNHPGYVHPLDRTAGCGIDIDECQNAINFPETDPCPFQECKDTDGSFECTACKAGYINSAEVGSVCVDLDECTETLDPCPENAICINSAGSYSCECELGALFNGTHCVISDTLTCAGSSFCGYEATCKDILIDSSTDTTNVSCTCDTHPFLKLNEENDRECLIGHMSRTCGEGERGENIEISCDLGKITGIQFASYGYPVGGCGLPNPYVLEPACHIDMLEFAISQCVGKQSCEFNIQENSSLFDFADTANQLGCKPFLEAGVEPRFYVQAQCDCNGGFPDENGRCTCPCHNGDQVSNISLEISSQVFHVTEAYRESSALFDNEKVQEDLLDQDARQLLKFSTEEHGQLCVYEIPQPRQTTTSTDTLAPVTVTQTTPTYTSTYYDDFECGVKYCYPGSESDSGQCYLPLPELNSGFAGQEVDNVYDMGSYVYCVPCESCNITTGTPPLSCSSMQVTTITTATATSTTVTSSTTSSTSTSSLTTVTTTNLAVQPCTIRRLPSETGEEYFELFTPGTASVKYDMKLPDYLSRDDTLTITIVLAKGQTEEDIATQNIPVVDLMNHLDSCGKKKFDVEPIQYSITNGNGRFFLEMITKSNITCAPKDNSLPEEGHSPSFVELTIGTGESCTEKVEDFVTEKKFCRNAQSEFVSEVDFGGANALRTAEGFGEHPMFAFSSVYSATRTEAKGGLYEHFTPVPLFAEPGEKLMLPLLRM